MLQTIYIASLVMGIDDVNYFLKIQDTLLSYNGKIETYFLYFLKNKTHLKLGVFYSNRTNHI